jgi:predicted RNA methylase
LSATAVERMGRAAALEGLAGLMALERGVSASPERVRLARVLREQSPVPLPEPIPVRLLGEVHERSLAGERQRRRSTGSFYTPQHVVRAIVSRTLGPPLRVALSAAARSSRRPAAAVRRRVLETRVVDPAMGCGFFLVESLSLMTSQAVRALSKCGRRPGPRWVESLRADAARSCLYGMDLDPDGAALARESVRLAAGPRGPDVEELAERLVVGDALRADAGGFHVVVGNPPYGAELSGSTRKLVSRRFATAAGYRNTALHFLERSLELAGPRGRVGLIVPKSLAYSRGWWAGAELVLPRLVEIVDASLAFSGVRLEQVIVLFTRRKTTRRTYATGRLDGACVRRTARVPRAAATAAGCLLVAVDGTEVRLFEDVTRRCLRLADVTRSARGLGLQGEETPRGRIRGVDGRAVRRWTIAGDLRRYPSRVTRLRRAAELMRAPKIVTQNIVAHVSRPRERILLTSAMDTEGLLTLDTVTNTFVTDPAVDPWLVLAVLNSEFISWWAHLFVFCRAVRTMHMDAGYLGRLPFPRQDHRPEEQRRAARLARELSRRRGMREDGSRVSSLDDVVCALYGVRPVRGGYGLVERPG